EIRGGAFISFRTSFGEIGLSGGYRDPYTPGPAGYYANVYLGFERWPPNPSASTARLPYKASPVVEAFNWSGFYAGGQVGFAWDTVDWSDVSLTAEPIHSKTFDWLVGGHAGYRWQTGPWVLGVEVALSHAGLKNQVASLAAPGTFLYINKIDVIGTVVGRLGYAVNRSLFYVDGGWATARLTTAGTNVLPDAFSLRSYEDGWTIGGGWSYALDNNWIV